MFRIGIIGGSRDTARLLRILLHEKGLTSMIAGGEADDYSTEFGMDMAHKDPYQADIWIERILNADGSAAHNSPFDILIVNDLAADRQKGSEESVQAARDLCHDTETGGGAVLVNSDEKELLQALAGYMDQGKIITYGLNNRACVTASSISDTGVQCCIQRALPAVSGHTLEQQEFSVQTGQASGDIHGVLAAATAAMLATQ